MSNEACKLINRSRATFETANERELRRIVERINKEHLPKSGHESRQRFRIDTVRGSQTTTAKNWFFGKCWG